MKILGEFLKMKKAILLALIVLTCIGCRPDAAVVSQNISQEADHFRVSREITFYNGITGEYMLVIEGLCSIEADSLDNQLEVTCKTGDDRYVKHFLGLSDNVSYVAEQIESSDVNAYHYQFVLRPESGR